MQGTHNSTVFKGQRLLGALVVLAFVTVATLGVAHSHDAPLIKQSSEGTGECSDCALCMLPALPVPFQTSSLPTPAFFWTVFQGPCLPRAQEDFFASVRSS